MPKPLSHFRVVDLSCVLAGPFATQLLADFGAELFQGTDVEIDGPGADGAAAG